MSAACGVSEQQIVADIQNCDALCNENSNMLRNVGGVRIVTSAVARNGNNTMFKGVSDKTMLQNQQNHEALHNEQNNMPTGGIRIVTSGAVTPGVMQIPAGEQGVTSNNSRCVVLGVCSQNQTPGPHIFMLQNDTLSSDFELPKEAVFLKIMTADVIGSDAALGEDACDFLGFWTKARSTHPNNKGRFNYMHTTLEYGSPLHGQCSRMVMVIPPELGDSPQITMNFFSSNHNILNLQNISVVVKSAGGGEQTVLWHTGDINRSADYVVDEHNTTIECFEHKESNTLVTMSVHEESNTLVTMQENCDARQVSLSFFPNDDESDQSHVKNNACVWEVWLNMHGVKHHIMDIHMSMET